MSVSAPNLILGENYSVELIRGDFKFEELFKFNEIKKSTNIDIKRSFVIPKTGLWYKHDSNGDKQLQPKVFNLKFEKVQGNKYKGKSRVCF